MKKLLLLLFFLHFPLKAEDISCSKSVNTGPVLNIGPVPKIISGIQNVGSRIHKSCPEWSYIPTDLLNSRLGKSCLATGKRSIFVYGEIHTDSEDNAVSWYVNELVNSNGKAVKFDEGGEFIAKERGFYGLNSIKTAQKYTSLLIYLAQADNPLFSKVVNLNLANSLCGLKDKFIASELPISSDQAKLIVSETKKILSSSNDECEEKLKSYFEQNSTENLKEVAVKFKAVIANQLAENEFKGVPQDKMDTRVIQELRELEWLEILKNAICDQDKNEKDFWLQVGKNHSDSLKCAMGQLFSEEIESKLLSIKTISKDDVRFFEKSEKIQKSVVDIFNSEITKLGLTGEVKFAAKNSLGIVLNLEDVPENSRIEVVSKVSPKLDKLNVKIDVEKYSGSGILRLRWEFKDLSFLVNNPQ